MYLWIECFFLLHNFNHIMLMKINKIISDLRINCNQIIEALLYLKLELLFCLVLTYIINFTTCKLYILLSVVAPNQIEHLYSRFTSLDHGDCGTAIKPLGDHIVHAFLPSLKKFALIESTFCSLCRSWLTTVP
jgi:hypothetical protein